MDLTIRSDLIGGSEPVRRIARVGNMPIATAYGNPQDDRWVLGWGVTSEAGWQDIVYLAVGEIGFRSRRFAPVRGYVVTDGTFEAVERISVKRHAVRIGVNDFLRKVADRSPEMLVVDSPDFQFEILLDPETLNPKILTLLTNSELAPSMARLVCEWHSIPDVRTDVVWMRKVIRDLCRNSFHGGREEWGKK